MIFLSFGPLQVPLDEVQRQMMAAGLPEAAVVAFCEGQAAKEAEMADLEGTTPEEMWCHDLDVSVVDFFTDRFGARGETRKLGAPNCFSSSCVHFFLCLLGVCVCV